MATTTFDAFTLVQSLRHGAFTAEQAEQLATAFSAAMKSDIATTSDIELAKTDLQKTIAETKGDLQKTIAETKGDLEKTIAETKGDLEKTIAETKGDLQKTIAETKGDLQKTIAETKVEILKWTFGAVGFQTLVVVGAILALARH